MAILMPGTTPNSQSVILHIEDRQVTRYTIGKILQRKGFAVVEAASGEEGLRVAKEGWVDLVILDVSLPDMSGFEVCRQIKADPATAKTPVLHLSASYVTDEAQVAGLEGGADGYLVQPVDHDVLVATVKSLLRLRRAEESQTRYAAILDATTDFVGIADTGGRVISVNRAGRRMVGIGEDDISNMAFADYHSEWARKIVLEQGVPSAVRDGAWSGETALLSRDGREIPVSQVIIAHKGQREEVEYFSTIARDITERKRAEEALRESSRRIENILESITEAFFAVDHQWRYTYINELALHTMRRAKGEQLTREDLLGENVWELYPEFVGSVFYRELHRALYEQKTVYFEGHSPRSDRWFEVRAYPSEEGLSVYSQDVTERKRVEAALARELRAKSDFLADVSHELRTPLTVIRGNAEVGLDLERDCVHTDLLEEIVEESGSLSRMVEDLLFLARSDSESLPLNKETVPAEQLLGGLARRAEALARKHGTPLQTALSGKGYLRCDAQHIEQAVLVLVDNAVKYGLPGEPINLSSSTRQGELLIEVADRGPGIPPEELPRIFERFYRGEDSSEERGSGLGLAIAKTIAEAHGGSIEAESRLGEGTRMFLHLPLRDNGS